MGVMCKCCAKQSENKIILGVALSICHAKMKGMRGKGQLEPTPQPHNGANHMITRSDYLDGNVTHREYYGDIVANLPQLMLPGAEAIKKALRKDENLNTIPLTVWDDLGQQQKAVIGREVCKRTNGGCSLSDLVCVLKEASRLSAV